MDIQEQIMNNYWVIACLESQSNRKPVFCDSHEWWLDRAGLFETGWLLFSYRNRYRNKGYGYPENDGKIWIPRE